MLGVATKEYLSDGGLTSTKTFGLTSARGTNVASAHIGPGVGGLLGYNRPINPPTPVPIWTQATLPLPADVSLVDFIPLFKEYLC